MLRAIANSRTLSCLYDGVESEEDGGGEGEGGKWSSSVTNNFSFIC